MISKLISNPLFLLMGLISLIVISEEEVAVYMVAGVAAGHTFVSSAILYLMNLFGDIATFLFNALFEIVVWITVIALILSAIFKGK